MKRSIVSMRALLIIAGFILTSCSSSPGVESPPYFAEEIITVPLAELDEYWVAQPSEFKMLDSKPEWIPDGAGKWQYDVVIDSNGMEVEKILLSSQPGVI